MLVSLNELKKYVDLSDVSAEEVANKLTSAGIEVEGIHHVAFGTNLVIGEVIECENHPDSDHLHVTKVNIGDEVLGIVCGAPNCRKGLKVIVAKPGAKLAFDKEIKQGVIRGVESNGMLCSLVELGVDPKSLNEKQTSGIEELNSDAIVGNTEVLKYLGLDDTILDLNLLANRSDAYALYNIAKEVAALFNKEVNIPEYKAMNLCSNDVEIGSTTSNCKLFGGRTFKGITIKESPDWMKTFLRNEGIRPINNIVDIGNYVMLVTGQPINMYDYDKLEKLELIARDDFEGKVLAMDDNEYELKKGDLVITSNKKVVCIAGIMTCNNSEISESTKNVVVEAASFYGPQIRRTTTRIGLTSDSSQRYVKGINPNQTEFVMELITHLIEELSGYTSASVTNLYDNLNYAAKVIDCTYQYINSRLGTSLSNEEILNALEKFNFKVLFKDEVNFKVLVPDARIDVEGKADLSEEVFRFVGVDNVEPKLPQMVTTVGGKSVQNRKETIISDYLLNQGLNKILTYTLLNKEDNEGFNLLNKAEGYSVINPNTEDHKYVRTNLLNSVLRCAQYNVNHQNKNFGIFEISQIENVNSVNSHLAFVLVGNRFNQDNLNPQPYNFFDAKGYFEEILKMFNIQANRVKYLRLEDTKELHPGRSSKVVIDGKDIAIFGELHPNIKSKYDFKKDSVVVFEMNLTKFFEVKSSQIHFTEINKFPSVTRDYAFVIDKQAKFSDISVDIKKSSSIVNDVHIFDIFEGDKVGINLVSIAISVTFVNKEHTLTDDEINEADKRIRSLIAEKYKALLRM